MMEFGNQYLTYSEYVGLGGTLAETPFNILELEAQKDVDKYTFGRLQDLETQINEVKVCIYQLIEFKNSYNITNSTKGNIASESIDGYSVSYNQNSTDTVKAKNEQVKGIIETYLAECYMIDGTPYLYCGVGK